MGRWSFLLEAAGFQFLALLIASHGGMWWLMLVVSVPLFLCLFALPRAALCALPKWVAWCAAVPLLSVVFCLALVVGDDSGRG